LIRPALSDHIAAPGEGCMDGKARFILPIVITAIIVSGVVTYFNIGLIDGAA